MGTIPMSASPLCTASMTSAMDGYGNGFTSPSGGVARRASSVNVPSGPRKATRYAPSGTRPPVVSPLPTRRGAGRRRRSVQAIRRGPSEAAGWLGGVWIVALKRGLEPGEGIVVEQRPAALGAGAGAWLGWPWRLWLRRLLPGRRVLGRD